MPVLARNPKHPTAGWGDGGGELLEAAPGTKNPSSALYFLPKLERPHFHHGLHSGQFRCTLQRPQIGGEGSSISCAFPKVNLLGRGATLESQGWVGGRRASFRAAQAGVAPAGRLFPGGAAGCCFLDV